MSCTVNAPLLIADNTDGEVIILNMESGKYYGTGEQQLAAAVTEIQEFFIAENLLKPLEGSATPTDAGSGTLAGKEFQHPVINSHTDMQGLLLLDPIHEVEDMGWPHKQVDG
jgi:hypothetical protein